MLKLILFAIIIWALALVLKIKMPVWIGQKGEKFVLQLLEALDHSRYKIINDLLLPSNGHSKTTQIDHVVVSSYGIFCIETKAYKGWIFGGANQEYWTQTIYHYKKRFYNPLRQNYAHAKAIESLLGPQRLKAPIITLVAFPVAEKLKISGTDVVGSGNDTLDRIKKYINVVYSDAERDELYSLLINANIIDKEERKFHNIEVKQLK